VCRARLTTPEWSQASYSRSLTQEVLDCRSAQPISDNDGEDRE
jgi:hypothetical protein